jgi:hypothetical protein
MGEVEKSSRRPGSVVAAMLAGALAFGVGCGRKLPDEITPTPTRTFAPGQQCLAGIILDADEQRRLLGARPRPVPDVENLRTARPPERMFVDAPEILDTDGHKRLRSIGLAVLRQLDTNTTSGLLETKDGNKALAGLPGEVGVIIQVACDAIPPESQAVVTPV